MTTEKISDMCDPFNFDHIIAEKTTNGNKSGFIDAITVWINKPHVVNRRLCGTCILNFCFVDGDSVKINDYLKKSRNSIGHNEIHQETTFLEIENLQDIPKNETAVIERKLIYKNSKDVRNNTNELILIEGTLKISMVEVSESYM